MQDFKEAYRLYHEPTFLFNIAQCQRQLGDFAAASGSYRAYRRESPDATNRPDVDRLIAEMDRQAQLHPKTESTATATPPPEPVHAPPPTDAEPAHAETTSAPVLVATAPPPKPVTKKAWFWVTVGGAVAVVGAAVALGVVFGTSSQPPTASVGKVNGN